MRVPVFLAALAVGLAGSLDARADGPRPVTRTETHVVQRGQKLETIAQHYHVTIHAIALADHLDVNEPLTAGQTLVIPGVRVAEHHDGGHAGGRNAKGGHDPPFERDVVRAVRLDEEFRIRVKDAHGRVPQTALVAFERLMRQGLDTHPPDPRLVALIGVVSNHFAGRTLEVVSGFRPYKPTQYTPDSRHNYGRALDFRVRGVPNEELRDFCRTLRDTGCGYYPNSTFVHLDVRTASAYWVDLAHPGEPPRYAKNAGAADEGTSDVTIDSH